jgi:hypothetical protein
MNEDTGEKWASSSSVVELFQFEDVKGVVKLFTAAQIRSDYQSGMFWEPAWRALRLWPATFEALCQLRKIEEEYAALDSASDWSRDRAPDPVGEAGGTK